MLIDSWYDPYLGVIILVRIKSGGAVEGVTKEFTRKYGVTMTPQEVEDGKLWLFELAPPQSNTSGGEV